MTAILIIVAYLVIGLGAAVAIAVQRQPVGPLHGAPAALVMVVLWPFFLPASLLGEPTIPVGAGRGPASARVEAVAERARAMWSKTAEHAVPGKVDGREQAAIDALVERLRRCDRRLKDLDLALAEPSPAAVRRRLEELRAATAKELEDGLLVLEDLSGQLLLLRFVAHDAPSTERDRVEALLSRVEALAEAL
jgi:hypothetical protein